MPRGRRYPIGAEVAGDAVDFRVWAPRRKKVEVVADGRRITLARDGSEYFRGTAPIRATALQCSRYGFSLDGSEKLFPDPASRSQPDGPHGLSEVVASHFVWRDGDWRGLENHHQVFYELHLGTFTREGTLAAACQELPRLRSLGVTAVELMPLADFPGRFGWGYDGVNLFAPRAEYGRPDDVRRFVDTAHGHGLGVILDVVYNHFGPDGNYLPEFSADYFTDRVKTDWGAALNFANASVREFFTTNARYWIEEFHFDGLRLDATQAIFDDSSPHILEDVQKAARIEGRSTLVIAENDAQEAHYIGAGIDALWNDDFQHSAQVALVGRRDGYYNDFDGSARELLQAVKFGYLYQGQLSPFQKKPRGENAFHLRAKNFVSYLENHDQVAHSARGQRLFDLAHPGDVRAMTMLWLLSPQSPLLFQGQEYGTRTPFLFFADHNPELAPLVRKGRGEFLRLFENLHAMDFDDPSAPATFEKCILPPMEENGTYRLHKALLALRPQLIDARIDGSVLNEHALCVRYFADHLLVVNFGATFVLPASEPLLAAAHWQRVMASEDAEFGGNGTPAEFSRMPGHAAILWRRG